MAPLPNYLRTHRKRAALSQEEVAFLLGVKGMNKANKVSRDEHYARTPTLESALAYEAIYGKPIRELFAGLYDGVEREVVARAKALTHRTGGNVNPNGQRALSELALRNSKTAL